MSDIPKLYPLRFQAAYQRKLWGGARIYKYKGIPTPYNDVGETWEISPMLGMESIVSVGPLAGKTLVEVVESYGAEILGQQVFDTYGGAFPLLFKLIDAHETLSVQVHPDDEYAQKYHNSRGKTEAWYVLECSEDANIYAGWSKPIVPDELEGICKDGSVMEYLRKFRPQAGDLYYLPAGIVHTIGAGCLLLEIQQASDLTYRVYDFNRKDDEGNSRELHLEKAVEVMNFSTDLEARIKCPPFIENHRASILQSPYFDVGMTYLTHQYLLELEDRDSFSVLFVDEGEVMLEYPHGVEHLRRGDFILLPATIKECSLMPASESAKLIDCYVPRI